MKEQSVLKRDWKDVPLVAIDLETSGQYPIQDDICELAAIRYQGGKIVDKFQSLVKPREKMSDFVIGIHGITNDMVKDAPAISEVIHDFHKFIDKSIVVAHHSPFDVGFLVVDFEKAKLALPDYPVFCSSLISRNVISGVENHKLQTLIKHLKLDGGQAHRAYDDANACLQLTLHCLEKKAATTVENVFRIQKYDMWWQDFSLKGMGMKNSIWANLLEGLEQKKSVEIIYMGGSQKGKKRTVKPVGIVRNPQGDFMVAHDGAEGPPKRFYFSKIAEAEVLFVD